ncbi:MAG: RHS repeat-associated core domain-containing protein [Pelobacteraceae bacterium]
MSSDVFAWTSFITGSTGYTETGNGGRLEAVECGAEYDIFDGTTTNSYLVSYNNNVATSSVARRTIGTGIVYNGSCSEADRWPVDGSSSLSWPPTNTSTYGFNAGKFVSASSGFDGGFYCNNNCVKTLENSLQWINTKEAFNSFYLTYDYCSSDKKLKSVTVNTAHSSSYIGVILLNGLRPTNVQTTINGLYNSSWDLPVATCNSSTSFSFSSVSGLVSGQFSVSPKYCTLSIDSLLGSSKIINPTSGGDLLIKGSISDSSGQLINWTLTMPDGKTRTGTGKSVSETWDGKDVSGKVVEPGSYSATLTAWTTDGQCIDTKPLNITVTKAEDGQCGLYVQFGSSAHMASGNLSHSQELFSSRGGALPVGMSLYYNSLDPAKGSLGRGWSHSYDLSLKENSDGSVLISEGNWKHKYYTLSNGVYTGQPGNYTALAKNSDGTFVLTYKNGQVYSFANAKIATITDRNGNTTAFAYNGGKLATVTDTSGRVVGFTYDSANHLTSLSDPSGNAYAFTVNDTLTSVTQPDGGTWRYTYDANSFMLTKTDPLGNVTGYAYDDQHRVITSTDPEGKTRSIAYPQTSDTVKSTSFTEKDGGVWNYSYDTASGYLLSKTDPQGGTTSYGYDANGNRTSTTNPDGTNTSATYDVTGNMLTSTDALGQTTGYTYNSFGQVTGITDPQGGTTAYAYDTRGNLTALTDPTGATTTYVYDTKGNIAKVIDPAGQTTSFTYDLKGNLTTVTDSSGATSSFSYDAAGNVTSSTDAKGAVTQFVYDSRNRLIKSIDPNGNATLYSYDANGNKLSDTDANGNITKYEYNGKNQLIKTTDALGNSTIYSYGGSSCPSCGGGNGEKLTTLTDANGNSTSYLYDQLGRLSTETDPKGNSTSYVYDAKGNLTTKTDANGNTISYSYDGNGRLLKKKYADNTEESYSYDAKGNILSATNKDIAYSFSYDAAGRIVSTTDSNNRFLQYSYDNTGRKTKTIYPEGSVVSYTYDGTGRLATITNGGGRTYSYSYNNLGRRTKLTFPNGATANYGYDTAGRLTNLDHKTSSNKIITSFSYTHDKVGNRLTKTEPDTTWNYGYDTVYRILQSLPTKQNKEKDEGRNSEKYRYDPVGNRLIGPQQRDSYRYGSGNQLLTNRHLGFSYDKNGNLTTKGKLNVGDYDHHDEVTNDDSGNRWFYSYDFENRLIKAETKNGDESATVSFTYDPFGRRIGKKVEKTEHGKAKEIEGLSYVYDGQTLILEYATQKDDEHQNKTGLTKYVHGPNIDEPLSMQRDNEVNFYHADGLGSVVALTDKEQKSIETYEYDSFGNLRGDVKPMQPFTYTGREWDKETGLYYYRARYYDPMDGLFHQKDPIGFDGGINVYAYVQNNPIKRKDPYGLAYFAKRHLGPLPWLGTNADDNRLNTELVHEQLFFEDGESPSNIGYFKSPEGEFHVGLLKSDSPNDLSSYRTRESGYDDCVMRKAYKKVTLLPYFELGFNCQAWADAVRKEYWKLYNSTK